jgi:hypothetical protein
VYRKILEISTISLYDVVTLNASFYYNFDAKFQCEDKILDYAKRSDYSKAKTLITAANGCGVIHDDVKYQIDSICYHSCFCTYRNDNFNVYMNLQKNFDKGIMPYVGGLLDQPAYLVDILGMLEGLKISKQNDEIDKENKRK